MHSTAHTLFYPNNTYRLKIALIPLAAVPLLVLVSDLFNYLLSQTHRSITVLLRSSVHPLFSSVSLLSPPFSPAFLSPFSSLGLLCANVIQHSAISFLFIVGEVGGMKDWLLLKCVLVCAHLSQSQWFV